MRDWKRALLVRVADVCTGGGDGACCAVVDGYRCFARASARLDTDQLRAHKTLPRAIACCPALCSTKMKSLTELMVDAITNGGLMVDAIADGELMVDGGSR